MTLLGIHGVARSGWSGLTALAALTITKTGRGPVSSRYWRTKESTPFVPEMKDKSRNAFSDYNIQSFFPNSFLLTKAIVAHHERGIISSP